jgi:gas vesicle protein
MKTSALEKAYLLVLGGFLGATAALLLAPQTGAKTRKQIVRYGKKAGTRAQKFVGAVGESLDEALEDVLKVGDQGLEKGKQISKRATHEVLEILDAGKKYLEEERVKLEKALK